MKSIGELALDLEAIEQGKWVDNAVPQIPGLRLQVRGLDNADGRRLAAKLVADLPLDKRVSGTIEVDDWDRINGEVALQTALLGWDGLPDDLYTPEKAAAYMRDPAMRIFRDAVVRACKQVDSTLASAKQAQAKN